MIAHLIAGESPSTSAKGVLLDPIRLILVDDNALLVAAWSRIVKTQPDFSLQAVLNSADNLTQVVKERAADAVILDLSMPGKDPLQALADLSRDCPSVQTMVYTGRPKIEYEDAALDAGAAACVDKLDPPMEILDQIRVIVRATSPARLSPKPNV
jgi:DNA-binding NarL/FixJ family response regulator